MSVLLNVEEVGKENSVGSADDLVMCLGDFNGHIGRHIDEVDGLYGVGQRNYDGRM